MGFFHKKAPTVPAGKIEFLIAGLGNPDRKYENTRHNAGFLAIDALIDRFGVSDERLKFKAMTGRTAIAGHGCLLMKPTTYMNLSGQAVTEAMRFYHLPPERVIVLFDDISLDVGRMRIRRKGSDGGHNGMKNIIYLSGSDQFPRIKIGVGKKPYPEYDLADWVLSAFRPEEREALRPVLEHCAEAVELMVGGKTDEAMNRFNS